MGNDVQRFERAREPIIYAPFLINAFYCAQTANCLAKDAADSLDDRKEVNHSSTRVTLLDVLLDFLRKESAFGTCRSLRKSLFSLNFIVIAVLIAGSFTCCPAPNRG